MEEKRDTKCGKCCYVQCGIFGDKEKECHCDNQKTLNFDNQKSNCHNCKHKDICF